ncbi:hypothetical protein [Peribacillus frigoritolerans]|uniref:hypothetical protein n=1 Tax=Peribacillus frigoritolerans TaxID=450367 RepID=UPI0010599BCC|nr:hypothetical protein [Peribacillus frigoritolerans]TDL76143.1 hypothetical protein E2R53_20825 [Peribacillus frigoritolerans]
MKKYILLIFLTVVIESILITAIIFTFNTRFPETMFFGSSLFVFLAFLLSSSGGFLSSNFEYSVFSAMAGSYQIKREESYLIINPFLVGSILFFMSYFIIYYFLY